MNAATTRMGAYYSAEITGAFNNMQHVSCSLPALPCN